MSVVINGIDLGEIDFSEVTITEKYEKGLNNILSIKPNGEDESSAEYLKREILAVRNLFDDLFGAGAGVKIVPVMSGRDAIKALGELIEAHADFNNAVARETREFRRKIAASKATNREQKRNFKKHNNRHGNRNHN